MISDNNNNNNYANLLLTLNFTTGTRHAPILVVYCFLLLFGRELLLLNSIRAVLGSVSPFNVTCIDYLTRTECTTLLAELLADRDALLGDLLGFRRIFTATLPNVETCAIGFDESSVTFPDVRWRVWRIRRYVAVYAFQALHRQHIIRKAPTKKYFLATPTTRHSAKNTNVTHAGLFLYRYSLRLKPINALPTFTTLAIDFRKSRKNFALLHKRVTPAAISSRKAAPH
jgi:hypothetical protein